MKYFLKPASTNTYYKACCDNGCESIPDLLSNGWSECDEVTYNAATLYAPPAPDPTTDPVSPIDERVLTLEQQLADADEAAISLYEAQVEQEEIIARHDEALLEIYERLGM